ncbi:MAG: carbohydrate-binding domain-containing protein [Bacteroidales bacterium]|nr:carbohydrate-binding domain-containing protein [Bacteroidales bacterium]MBR6864820.1 carbohydrate-binding domain-containing protein [Bacteroidales bacterium]
MKKTVAILPVLIALSLQGCTKDPIDIALPDDDTTTPVNADDSAGSDIEADKDDDNVANTTFARTVKVTFNGGSATVTGATSDFTVAIDGAGVTITNNGSEAVIYDLSGTSTDGYFKLYSTRKQEILLNGLSLTNKQGAAINNQSHKRTFVVVKGTNTLADGASYTQTPSDEDEKAAFFSEGQLVFSGDGTLTVNATGKAGITSDDYVRFMGSPTVKVISSAGHGVRGKEAIIVSDGTVDVDVSGTGKKGFSSDTLVYIGGGVTTIKTTGSAGTVDGELTGVAGIKADLRFEMVDGILNVTSTGTGAKGISGDNVAYFKGGTVTVDVSGANYGTSSSGGFGPGGGHGGPGGWGGGQSSSSDNSVASKGIKFDGNLYISGGKISVKSAKHEAIEAKGVIQVSGGEVYAHSSDDAINAGGDFTIEGGAVYAQSTGNDGLDANGNFYIKGGIVFALGSGGAELAVDANSEQQKKLYLTGGTVIAVGGLESGASLSQPCWSAGTVKANTAYALFDNDGKVLGVFKTPTTGNLTLVLSAPSLNSVKHGVTISGGTSLLNGVYTQDATVSGGSGCTLSSYSGGGQGGPGGW